MDFAKTLVLDFQFHRRGFIVSDLEIIASLLLAIMLTLILGVLILSRNLHILGRKSALDTTSENYSLLKINKILEDIREELQVGQATRDSKEVKAAIKKIEKVAEQYVVKEI